MTRHLGLRTIGAILLCCASALAIGEPANLSIHFPVVPDRAGKSFSSIMVAISCAHFRAITSIPDDWYVRTLRPAFDSDTRWKPYGFTSEGLELGAGHGASRIADLAAFNGAIQIVVEDAACFDVTVEVEDDMSDDGWPKTLLRRSDLVLK